MNIPAAAAPEPAPELAPEPASEPAAADRRRLGELANGYVVSRAVRTDVPAVVGMLRDDDLRRGREVDASDPRYSAAFDRMEADPNQVLAVLVDPAGVMVGSMQLTLIAGLSRAGATRVLIEAVRISAAHRGGGLGSAFLTWAIDYSRQRGASLMQLTTDQRRVDAHRFYQRLGFVGSHLGMKLDLGSPR
jgi:GNAT superfamily N-acetyltransferase